MNWTEYELKEQNNDYKTQNFAAFLTAFTKSNFSDEMHAIHFHPWNYVRFLQPTASVLLYRIFILNLVLKLLAFDDITYCVHLNSPHEILPSWLAATKVTKAC